MLFLHNAAEGQPFQGGNTFAQNHVQHWALLATVTIRDHPRKPDARAHTLLNQAFLSDPDPVPDTLCPNEDCLRPPYWYPSLRLVYFRGTLEGSVPILLQFRSFLVWISNLPCAAKPHAKSRSTKSCQFHIICYYERINAVPSVLKEKGEKKKKLRESPSRVFLKSVSCTLGDHSLALKAQGR